MGNEIFDWGRAIIIGGRWHKNLVGTISEGYKSRGAPMVNIKDFILASKNLGGGARAPSSYTPPAHGHYAESSGFP